MHLPFDILLEPLYLSPSTVQYLQIAYWFLALRGTFSTTPQNFLVIMNII